MFAGSSLLSVPLFSSGWDVVIKSRSDTDLPQRITIPKAMVSGSGSANTVLDQPTLQQQKMQKQALSAPSESHRHKRMVFTMVRTMVSTMMPTTPPWHKTAHMSATSTSLHQHTAPTFQLREDITPHRLALASTPTDMTIPAQSLQTTKGDAHVNRLKKLLSFLVR